MMYPEAKPGVRMPIMNVDQFLIAASGSFEVQMDDGKVKKTVMLNQPYRGCIFHREFGPVKVNFSSGAICLVMASHNYYEMDYIRDYKSFTEWKLKK